MYVYRKLLKCIYKPFVILVKQVFSDMDFIGWYTTGDTPSSTDIKVHKQICEIYESPILLKLNPYDKNIEVINKYLKLHGTNI